MKNALFPFSHSFQRGLDRNTYTVIQPFLCFPSLFEPPAQPLQPPQPQPQEPLRSFRSLPRIIKKTAAAIAAVNIISAIFLILSLHKSMMPAAYSVHPDDAKVRAFSLKSFSFYLLCVCPVNMSARQLSGLTIAPKYKKRLIGK